MNYEKDNNLSLHHDNINKDAIKRFSNLNSPSFTNPSLSTRTNISNYWET